MAKAERSRTIEIARLFRLSIAFSPVADVLTGCFAASGGRPLDISHTLFFAIAASVSAFCFGVSLNDYLDRVKDSNLAPERPIPSGSLTPRFVLFASVASAAAALFFSAFAGLQTMACVAVVLILCGTYNLWARRIEWLGVINLGCIRAADVLVGASLRNTSIEADTSSVLPLAVIVILYGAYGISLSALALSEKGQKKLPIRIPAAVAVLLPLAFIPDAVRGGVAVPAVVLWLVLALPVYRFFQEPERKVESLVGHFISGFFLVGSLAVLGAGHPFVCALMWILYFVSKALSRLFPPS